MLIIGHRGAAGLAPENTLEALQKGIESGADMIEFDVRLTADKIPILSHDAKLNGLRVRTTTLAHLQAAGPVAVLESVLKKYVGKIYLNLEYKPVGDIDIVYAMLKKYVKRDDDWDSIIISSFHVTTLFQLRRLDEKIKLALLHSINPFAFMTYQRRLNLAAVGWHRLHANKLAIEIARRSDIFTYVYTINRLQAALLWQQRGVDGIVTDYPNRFSELSGEEIRP